ncbi:MAG: hypothetical protein JW997_06685 [Actinobacteria bacterium]|nr:hypothetical protein [Actinomycetota bacterium]
MQDEIKLSIANLSQLSEQENFLLQVSCKSENLSRFIKSNIPSAEKEWLSDYKSWEISRKWIKEISDICIAEYEQVFFDIGEELLDLKDEDNYQEFRKKILVKKKKNNN